MRPGAGHHNEVSSREDWVMVSERMERGAAGVLGLALSPDPTVCLVLSTLSWLVYDGGLENTSVCLGMICACICFTRTICAGFLRRL